MSWRTAARMDLRELVFGLPARDDSGRLRRIRVPLRKARARRDLLAVTDVLATLVRANVPLADGIAAALEDAPSFRLKRILAILEHAVGTGHRLSEAMVRSPGFFPPYYTATVQAGERTGTLYEGLWGLREVLVEGARLRSRARQYAAYILIVWTILVALGLMVLRYIAPAFAEVFRDMGVTPPPVLQVAVDLGAVAHTVDPRVWVGLLLAGLPALAVAATAIRTTLRGKGPLGRAVGRVLLGLPLVGPLVARDALAHGAAIAARLLEARVPLHEALAAAADLSIDPVYAGAFARAGAHVEAGEALGRALERERVFPASFRGFVAAGEGSGLLPQALDRVARLYRRQVLRSRRVLLDVLSPLGIVAAGCMVLLFFASVMQSLASLIDGLSAP